MEPRRIDLEEGAHLSLYDHFLRPEETGPLFTALLREVPFQARTIRIFGREVMQPRLVAWVGEPEAVYRYSGVANVPTPFGPTLSGLRDRVAEASGLAFNSVLCNLYRDGHDAMGMHSDKEPELGAYPVIASLSLGATRRFVLRHHKDRRRAPCDLLLADGSLLVMRGSTQRIYRHGVPREHAVTTPRINLTFRRIVR